MNKKKKKCFKKERKQERDERDESQGQLTNLHNFLLSESYQMFYWNIKENFWLLEISQVECRLFDLRELLEVFLYLENGQTNVWGVFSFFIFAVI